MNNTYKTFLFCTIQTIIFTVCAFFFWNTIYPAHLHFHEQFQLFQYSSHYLFETISLPGGVTHYISRFLVQFFYITGLGAAIMALLLTCIQLSAAINIKKGNNFVALYPLSFIPAIAVWIFLLKADAMPVLAINTTLSLLSVYFCKKIQLKTLRYSCEVITAIILFFIAGGNSLIFILIIAAYEIGLSIKGRLLQQASIIAIASIAIFLILPLVGTFVYNYPYNQLIKGYASFRYPTFDCSEREIALIITIVTLWILQSIDIAKKINNIIKAIIPISIAIISIFIIHSKYDKEEENIFEYDYLTRFGKWDEIIEKANLQKPTNIWEECCLNLALAQKGILCDKMFSYNQQGINSLLPIYRMDYMTPMIGGEPYFYIGIVNTAQRFSFEAMEAIPDYQKSARCYKRLIQTNIINKRYAVAAEYIRILEKTTYYKKWAMKMKAYLYNDEKVCSDILLGPLQKIRYKKDFFFNEDKVEGMIAILLMENPHNWMAWQYLFATCLEKKDLPMLMQFVELMNKKWPKKRLPIHVQEALLIAWTQKTGKIEGYPWNIDSEVKERFVKFANAANQPKSIADNALRMQFADTYGYYYLLGKENIDE